MNWDEYFLSICRAVKTKSIDPTTQTCAVIVDQNHSIRATGFNGLPRGVKQEAHRVTGKEKYIWTEHAERNAIYNAARMGTPLEGCTMYMLWYPCMACARAIIQVGIVELVCSHPNLSSRRWGTEFSAAAGMLSEAGVQVHLRAEEECG